MTKFDKIRLEFKVLYWDVKCFFRNCKRRLWNKRIKMWYNCLFFKRLVGKNGEFDSSFSLDTMAMFVMSDKEFKKYDKELAWRKHRAHLMTL